MDPTQNEAVTNDSQYLQIIGFPGSGKTLVMAHRVARLIAEGVDSSAIVCLTFTNSAHLRLRREIQRVLSEDYGDKIVERNILDGTSRTSGARAIASQLASEVNVNTFHGFSSNLISAYGERVGLTADFDMMDFLDPHNLLYNPLSGIPKGYQNHRNSRSVNAHDKSQLDAFMTKYKTYDFDTASKLAAKILQSHESIRVSHSFVDEFQDCTNLQWQLMKAMSQNHPKMNMIVCGDPNQEIFTFQEDHFRNAFARMKEEIPETRAVELLYNYRSTPEIVDTIQSLVKDSGTRPHGQIRAVHPSGPEPEMIQCAMPDWEVKAVVESIQQSHNSHAVEYKDIGVLVRTQSAATLYTNELKKAGIPSTSFFSIRGVGIKKSPCVALTSMKWAHNPKDVYLMQLSYNRFTKFIRPSSIPASQSKIRTSSETSSTQDLVESNPKMYSTRFLSEWLPSSRHRLVTCEKPEGVARIVEEAITKWPAESGSRPRITDTDRGGWHNFVRLMTDVTECINMSELPLEQQSEQGAALKHVLDRSFSREDGVDSDSTNRVLVSTIHSAKSREWPAVISPSTKTAFGFGMDSPIESSRLQYVAASRAQRWSYFSNSGAVTVGSRNSFVPVRKVSPSVPSLSVADASKLYPLVFRPFVRI